MVRDGCALMTALAPCGGGGRVVEWQGAGVMLDDGPWPLTSVASGLSPSHNREREVLSVRQRPLIVPGV